MIKNLVVYEDFKKVFTVFQGKPFYELWNDEMIREEYENFKEKGKIFGFYNDENEILGITTVLPGNLVHHNIEFEDNKKVLYLSDIAVLEKVRGQRIGGALMGYTITYALEQKAYDFMYLRTNLVGSMSEGIAKIHGFEIYKKNNQIVTEDVEFPRTIDTISSVDTRKFLVKKLRNY